MKTITWQTNMTCESSGQDSSDGLNHLIVSSPVWTVQEKFKTEMQQMWN